MARSNASDPGADLVDATGGETWTEIPTGLGDEIELNEGDAVTGNFLGMTTQPVKDNRAPDGVRQQSVYQFDTGDGAIRFLWGSYDLDVAFRSVEQGARVRVTYLGRRDIGSDRQPMKSYRVQVAH